MRHFVIASIVTGSVLVAASASAQQQPGYTPGAPAPTYTPAPVQPAPSPQPQYGQAPPAAQPAPQQQQPQYGQTGAQPQPQYAPAQPQPQYAPQQQPQPQPQYGQPQPQYAPQQQPQYGQQQPQPGYGGSASFGGSPAPEMAPIPGSGDTWRPSNAKFIIAGERLFGFSALGGTVSVDGQSFSGNATMVNFLWSNSSVDIAGFGGINPFTMPMLTFHGVVAGGLTLGGGIGYASTSGSHDAGGGTTIDDPTRSAVAVAPRIGYLASFSPKFGIWPKGGITYFSQKREGTTQSCDNFGCTSITSESAINGVAISIDTMFVLAPVPHVGILFGPTIDIGVSGTMTDTGTADRDLTLRNFGAAAGLALLF